MEIPITWSAFASAWLATLAVLILLSKHMRQRKLKFPPGPKPWPIIGNLNLMGSLPHRSLHQLSHKYGAIMQVYFGSIPVVVVSSVEMAKVILKTMDATFAGRPITTAGKYTTYNCSGITWTQYGPYSLLVRKMCQMELFSAKRIESYEHIRVEEVHSLVKDLYKSSGKPVLLKDYLSTTSLNVISRMVLGKRYLDESENCFLTPKEFNSMFQEMVLLNGVLNIGDYIPWLNFLDLQGYIRRMKILASKFDGFLEQIVDDYNARREGVENYVAKDMVDVLLQAAEDPILEMKLERHQIKALILELLTGGTETSAITVEWAMSELLKHPEVLNKVIEELDRVIGKNRWVEEKDIAHLPYFQAIIKEIMRIHPTGPLLVPRAARENCKIDGYNILKGTMVIVNVWAIGRNPNLWDEPNEFRPERFVGKSIDNNCCVYDI